MNFVKQFGIDDALDRLHAKYGDDWDVEADLNDNRNTWKTVVSSEFTIERG